MIAVCCCFFHRSHRFLFSSTDLLLAIGIGNVASHRCGSRDHRGYGPPAQASFDEGRSGRSAGTNTSLAVKPFLLSSPGGSWEIAVAISFWPAVVGRVGEEGSRRQGLLLMLWGVLEGATTLIRRPTYCYWPPDITRQPSYFIVEFLFFFSSSLMMRGRKRRSGSTRNNQTENGSARLRLRWSLDMRRGPWKVSEETQERLANSCPLQSKLCYFGAEMLATAMFPRRGLRACAKRCAADSRCKNRSATTRPPRPQPPDHTTTKHVDACPLAT